jgi:hypothetical protein
MRRRNQLRFTEYIDCPHSACVGQGALQPVVASIMKECFDAPAIHKSPKLGWGNTKRVITCLLLRSKT